METQASEKVEGGWTRERVELLKRTVVPKGIPDDEFMLFLEQCKRSGLDPLIKEAFCVARRVNLGTREKPNWGTKYEFQPSEAGFLTRAERFPDYEGIQAQAVFAEDEIQMDAGAGTVRHVFNPAKRKGSLSGAWARVQRRGKVPVLVWLDFNAYVQSNAMWGKIPTTMIEKCARVAALRKAYPEAFGGLYVPEELPADVAGEPVEHRQAEAPRPALPAATQVEVLPPVSAPRETVAKQAKAAEVRERVEKHLGKAPGIVTFGPHKGAVIAELADKDLADTIDLGDAKLAESPDAKWADGVRACMDLLLAEHSKRANAQAYVANGEQG
jgi:phage recombination protein Bet